MTAVRQFLECFALSGLGVCALALLGVWCDRHQVFPGRRLLGAFRRLPRPVQFFLLAFSLHLIVHGSIKTNAVGGVEGAAQQRGRDILVACNEAVATLFSRDRNVASPLGGKGRGAGRAPYGLGRSVAPEVIARGWRLVEVNTNATFDYSMPSNAVCYAPWTLRGAAEDWTRIELGSENEELGRTDWRFPFGTNDLSSVQVFTDGTIRPKLHSLSDVLAAVGSPMSAIPGVSRFWYAVGTNDSRILTWENFALGRIPLTSQHPQPFLSAQIELWKSGDYIVRSNAVERVFRFIDSFDWPDGEWNQSDAERAAVDAAVGTGLENGYYKLTATVPLSVGRRTLITVGDQQLAVDRPGEYAFLLAKGEEYALSLEPFSSDITFDAVDDIAPPMTLMGLAGESNDHLGHWTVDGGGYALVAPTPLLSGLVSWMPTFHGSPDVSHIWMGDSQTFTAILDDFIYPHWASYEWTCDDANVLIESPHSRETRISFGAMPSWHETTLKVTATIGTNELESVLCFNYGYNSEPQAYPSLTVPDPVVLNGRRRKIQVGFDSDRSEDNGTLHLRCVQGRDRIRLWSSEEGGAPVSFEQDWNCGSFSGFECYVAGTNTSETVEDVLFQLDYVSEEGETNSVSRCLTVVDFVSEPICTIENTYDPARPYMNPCAIRSGRPETFWAILLPADVPANWLTWHAKVGNATFPEGNVGSRVSVDSTSSGLLLEARINGYDDEPDPIEFKIDVIHEED